MAAAVLATGWWSLSLLNRSSGWHPWVGVLVVGAAAIGTVALLIPQQRVRRAGVIGAIAGLVTIAGGSAAYALSTAAAPEVGSVPSAGPAVSGGGARIGGAFPGRAGAFPGRAGGGSDPLPAGFGAVPGGFGRPDGRAGGAGAPDGSASVSSALVTLLQKTSTTWAAATVGSQSAAPIELQSGKAVMAIGGFTGSDTAPTLAQFKQYVADGKVRYFIAGEQGRGAGPGGGRSGNSASAITSWVKAHFASRTVGGTTVYDLTAAA
jgi:hypothetical protein